MRYTGPRTTSRNYSRPRWCHCRLAWDTATGRLCNRMADLTSFCISSLYQFCRFIAVQNLGNMILISHHQSIDECIKCLCAAPTHHVQELSHTFLCYWLKLQIIKYTIILYDTEFHTYMCITVRNFTATNYALLKPINI